MQVPIAQFFDLYFKAMTFKLKSSEALSIYRVSSVVSSSAVVIR